MEKLQVRILGISCAHRKSRNTAWLIQYALQATKKFGRRISEIADIETEFIDLGDKYIKPCLGCRSLCLPNKGIPLKRSNTLQDLGGCPINTDYLAREVIPKLPGTDGFIFGAPTFNGTVTSKFSIMIERFNVGVSRGYFTNKPAGGITCGIMPIGGQEICLRVINECVRELEMIPISWMQGAASTSGPPFGPLPADDDGSAVGAKKDKLGQWWAIRVGRRVAEFAVMLKLFKHELGDLYYREFMQRYHPPFERESWAWEELDKEDEDYAMSLVPPPRKEQRAKFRELQ